jgi:hypothetical protein
MSNLVLPEIKNYEDALNYLKGKPERPCGNNTRILSDGNDIKIRHWTTDIVTYKPNGDIILANGGHFSQTTKERLNNFIPNEFSIWQEKGLWRVSNRNLQISQYWAEGITLKSNGRIVGGKSEKEGDRVKNLTKKINDYAKEYVRLFINGEIPQPSGADCWYCYMVTDDGESLGDKTSSDHLNEHLKEKYYVPSILMKILKDGNRLSQFNKVTIAQIWGFIEGEPSQWQKEMIKRDLPKQISKFFKERLGIAK